MNRLMINNNFKVFERNVGILYRYVSLCCKEIRYRGEKQNCRAPIPPDVGLAHSLAMWGK